MKNKNLILILLCAVIMLGSLFLGSKKGGEFGGADDQIEEVIGEVNKDYEPWFSSVWEPPSGEVESLLFASQAAIGAGFIGYYIGRKKGAKAQ